MNLNYENDIEYTIALFEDDKIIGTGSISGNVLKCIAVEVNKQGEGIASKIVSRLLNEQFKKGRTKNFLFTSPDKIPQFIGLGFRLLAVAEPTYALLEIGLNGIDQYLQNLQKHQLKKNVKKTISAMVINANPFTLGHQYLVRTASKESDVVFLFVVREDKSLFPFATRFSLIKQGCESFKNVKVIDGGDYIISNATFPTYFSRASENNIIIGQAKLDAKIFLRYIAPILKINRRYVGNEPYCGTTNIYNRILRELLPPAGVELKEISRFEIKGKAVSASSVRRLIKKSKFDEIQKLVPPSTYRFLASEDAIPIIKKIVASDSRH
jgi:[citrate (pro-3S)-lyase] ligase